MRGSAALEADEETAEASMFNDNIETQKMMNNGANVGKNGLNNPGEIKYPANCALRLGSTPGSADGPGEDNDIYEPKQNKKIFRILTVLVYVFTVSFGELIFYFKYDKRIKIQ